MMNSMFAWYGVPGAKAYRVCKKSREGNQTIFRGLATAIDLDEIDKGRNSDDAYRVDVLCNGASSYVTIVPFTKSAKPPSDGVTLTTQELPDVTAWRIIIRDASNEVVLDQVAASPRFTLAPTMVSIAENRTKFLGWAWREKKWKRLAPGTSLNTPIQGEKDLVSQSEAVASLGVDVGALFVGAAELPNGSVFRLSIDLLNITAKRARFLSHSRPSNDFPNGVLVAGDQSKPTIYISRDLGEIWEPLKLQIESKEVVQRHYLTRDCGHIVQTKAGKTFCLDQTGRQISVPAVGTLPWHGAWSIDQSGTGIIIFSQYQKSSERIGGNLHVWRSADKGVTWTAVLTMPGRLEEDGTEIRHFHTCQADPFKPGRWYVSSGDKEQECGIWFSDDDGQTWERVPVRIEGAEDLEDQFLPKLHRMTAFSIREDYLVWPTDDKFNHDHAVLVTLDKETWKTRVWDHFDSNLMRSYIDQDDEVSVAVSESKNFVHSASVYVVCGDRKVGTRIALDNVTNAKGSFIASRSSLQAANRTFFSLPDGHVLTRNPMGTLRWRFTKEEAPLNRHYLAGNKPFSMIDGVPVHWFPASFIPQPDDLLAFFHTQRTGGTSFRGMLEKIYDGRIYSRMTTENYRHWKQLQESDLQNFTVYAAHTCFWEKFFRRRVLPISIVRDPVQRIISLYRLIRVSDEHGQIGELARQLEFDAWCREVYNRKPDYLSNSQTRFICAAADAAYAIQLIGSRYFGVGADVYRNEFHQQMAKTLGWPDKKMPRLQVAPTPMNFEVSDTSRDFLTFINKEDILVYNFVLRVWESTKRLATQT